MAASPTSGREMAGTLREFSLREKAFREASGRFRRLMALEELAEMGRAGDFDALLDKRAYRAQPPG